MTTLVTPMSQTLATKWQLFPQPHRYILIACIISLSALAFWPSSRPSLEVMQAPTLEEAAQASSAETTAELQTEALVVEPLPVQYTIEQGDTLSTIFNQFRISNSTMRAILASDEELLALDVLKPGQQLVFQFSADDFSQTLESMTLIKSPAHKVAYQRVDDKHFSFEEFILDTEWLESVYAGQIEGSFYVSAKRAGLNDDEIVRATHIFQEQINFARDIRAGDRFEVVVGREMVGDTATGSTRIEGVRLHSRGKTISAFLHEDGHFYNHKGESLTPAFLRYPTARQYRISSPFNPRRLHPITGRVSPHNGVDFATPIGTPVLSTGDGIVTRVRNHPFAGIYVEIEHSTTFKTRYLHLNRALVKPGQRVTRGQRIALSGNTGRSTGPHLHFELHVNNRPVNPLKADIPMVSAIDKKALPAFNDRVAMLENLMVNHSTNDG